MSPFQRTVAATLSVSSPAEQRVRKDWWVVSASVTDQWPRYSDWRLRSRWRYNAPTGRGRALSRRWRCTSGRWYSSGRRWPSCWGSCWSWSRQRTPAALPGGAEVDPGFSGRWRPGRLQCPPGWGWRRLQGAQSSPRPQPLCWPGPLVETDRRAPGSQCRLRGCRGPGSHSQGSSGLQCWRPPQNTQQEDTYQSCIIP